jgi:hypothetical protein
MTAQLDIDRLLDDFLGDGARVLSDHVLDAALGDIETTRQRRAWRVPRTSDMPTPLRLLAAAALLAAAVGGAFLLGGNLKQTTPPEPAPSPEETTSTNGLPIVLGADVNGTWVSYSPAVFGSQAGDYAMTVTSSPSLMVKGPDGRDIFLGLLDDRQTKGRAVLGPTDGCAESGSYTYAMSNDFRTMTIEVVRDTCADRAKLLASSWVRASIDDFIAPGQPYVVDLDPRISFVVPSGFRVRGGRPPRIVAPMNQNEGHVIVDAEDEYAIIHAATHLQADRCDQARGHRSMPASFADFLEWNRASTGVTVSEPRETTVDGFPAVVVDVTPTADCPNGEVPPNCYCMPDDALVIGMIDRIWAVDVNGKIVLIQFHDDNPPFLEFTSERQALAQEFVDSIKFE